MSLRLTAYALKLAPNGDLLIETSQDILRIKKADLDEVQGRKQGSNRKVDFPPTMCRTTAIWDDPDA